MQKMLNNRKFKFLVTIVLLVTFMNLSVPFNSFIGTEKAYAANMKKIETEKTGVFAAAFSRITTL